MAPEETLSVAPVLVRLPRSSVPLWIWSWLPLCRVRATWMPPLPVPAVFSIRPELMMLGLPLPM